ncbi:MAG: hypothetical protein ACXQTR_00995 [Candidatus Methanospirareceae archaeon]
MAAVTLPDAPESPHELEDYVAALFQSAGFFVEKNIIERDSHTEILELDVVATNYDEDIPFSVLAEVKSGQWGFPDLFKLIGWMKYLQIPQGAFFVSESEKEPAFVERKVTPLDVKFIYLDDFAESRKRFATAGFPTVSDPLLLKVWRYAYLIERTLIDRLRRHKNACPSSEEPATAMGYHNLINNGIFFVNDIRDRLNQLYNAYWEHPKLSLGLALEMDGREFDPNGRYTESTHFREAMLDGTHDPVQACFYLEHRARLSILKTAIDWVCLSEQGSAPTIPGAGSNMASDWLLPSSFRNGLDTIKNDPYFKRYALFWQVFLWGFGGFYLEDRKDIEFGWLAKQTGIPVEEIPRALRVFDVLFPLPSDSWLKQTGPTHCKIVKLVPAAFRGLGVNHRFWRYRYKTVEDFRYDDHTVDDLIGWKKNVYELLVPVQSTKEGHN